MGVKNFGPLKDGVHIATEIRAQHGRVSKIRNPDVVSRGEHEPDSTAS